MTVRELNWLVEAQLAKWREQEVRKREQRQKEVDREAAQQHTKNLKLQAEEDTRAAQENVDRFRTILIAGLDVKLALDWDRLLDMRTVPPFRFSEPKPDREEIRQKLLRSKPVESSVAPPVFERPSFFESFLPFLRDRRLRRKAEAVKVFEQAKMRARAEYLGRLKQYEARKKEATRAYIVAVNTYNEKIKHEQKIYLRERDEFVTKQEAHNSAVLAFRSRYEAGSPEAVERYLQMVLERSSYPQPIAGEPEGRFDEASKTLVTKGYFLSRS